MLNSRSTVALAFLLTALTGCGTTPQPSGQAAQEVLVFAAASTAEAVDEIKRQFEADAGVRVRTSFAGSSTLAEQIIHGADANLFLSANRAWANRVEAAGLVAQRRDLLGNRLVIVVPGDSTLDIRELRNLAQPAVQHLALADPQAVPAGKYAKQAMEKLGVWEAVKPKVVAAADVRQALVYVETGAAEAGIVYATDAAVGKSVRVAAQIDPQWSEPIRYSAVLLKHAAGNAAAESFYRHLSSPAAAKVFERRGFIVLADGTQNP